LNNTFFQLQSFISYFLDNVDEHSLHSPFFFRFYNHVVKTEIKTESVANVESYRKKLLEDERVITVEDLGAGSAFFKANSSRKVNDIARISLSPPKFSNLYLRIIKEYDLKNVVELGTSLGLNTLYLALLPSTQVKTYEGSESIANIAQELFDSAGYKNIKLIRGNIDSTLPIDMRDIDQVDFALIDANHRFAPTLNYFEILASRVSGKSVIAIDDIHASPEMERAWHSIRQHSKVQATADLYRCGLVFFDPSLNKQHVVLRF
jgi:predicted O-methyltransferase YrrM